MQFFWTGTGQFFNIIYQNIIFKLPIVDQNELDAKLLEYFLHADKCHSRVRDAYRELPLSCMDHYNKFEDLLCTHENILGDAEKFSVFFRITN